DLVFVDGPLTRPDPVGFVRRAMAYAPAATLVVYGLPEPAVASALIAAGARGVIRGGDTDLVTAVTKTVLLLGYTDASRAERARGRRDGGVNGRRERVTVPVGIGGGALDTRNGGPGFAGPRGIPAVAMEAVPRAAALAGVGAGGHGRAIPALVPQQRVDVP